MFANIWFSELEENILEILQMNTHNTKMLSIEAVSRLSVEELEGNLQQ